MKESDLFLPIKSWLLQDVGCQEVYAEINNIDILGIHGVIDFIVETKMHLSFKLLEQARDRLNYAPYVYVAVPQPKGGKKPLRIVQDFLNQYKVGLLYVNLDSPLHTITIVQPARFSHTFKRLRNYYNPRKHIKSYSSEQIAGVRSGQHKTDYKVMIENIKWYLLGRDWVTVEDILKNCETKYANPRPSIIATLRADWNRNWCEVKRERHTLYFRVKKEEPV